MLFACLSLLLFDANMNFRYVFELSVGGWERYNECLFVPIGKGLEFLALCSNRVDVIVQWMLFSFHVLNLRLAEVSMLLNEVVEPPVVIELWNGRPRHFYSAFKPNEVLITVIFNSKKF